MSPFSLNSLMTWSICLYSTHPFPHILRGVSISSGDNSRSRSWQWQHLGMDEVTDHFELAFLTLPTPAMHFGTPSLDIYSPVALWNYIIQPSSKFSSATQLLLPSPKTALLQIQADFCPCLWPHKPSRRTSHRSVWLFALFLLLKRHSARQSIWWWLLLFKVDSLNPACVSSLG